MPNSESSRSILKYASRYSLGTLLSRITGMARDVSLAYFFGTHAAIGAFFVSYRLSQLFRRIFGEGALFAGWIPTFSNKMQQSPKEAALFLRDSFYSLGIIIGILVAFFELLLWVVHRFGDFIPQNEMIIVFTQIMLPGLFLIFSFTLASAFLQCVRSFFLQGIAPAIHNLVFISFIFFVKDIAPKDAIVSLSYGILVALLCQVALLLPKLFRFLWKNLSPSEWIRPSIFSNDFMTLIKSLGITILGVGAVQLNTALDTVFARYSSLEGPAYLVYAIRLQQIPFSLVAISLASSLLPTLATIKENVPFIKLLKKILNKTLIGSLFFSFAFIAFGDTLINLVYGRGEFQAQSTIETTKCLWGYAIGLAPMAFTLLISQAFYARKEYAHPAYGSLIGIFVNVSLNSLFILGLGMGPASVAYATSIASVFQGAYLYKVINRSNFNLSLTELFEPFIKPLICATLAAGITLYIGTISSLTFSSSILLNHVQEHYPNSLISQITSVCYLGLLYTSVFSIAILVLSYPLFTKKAEKQVT